MSKYGKTPSYKIVPNTEKAFHSKMHSDKGMQGAGKLKAPTKLSRMTEKGVGC